MKKIRKFLENETIRNFLTILKVFLMVITILKIPCGLISTRQPWLWWHKGLPFINYNTIERKFQYNVMTSKSCNYPSNYASQKTKNKSP